MLLWSRNLSLVLGFIILMESRRQQQVSRTLQQELSEVFRDQGTYLFDKAMVTIISTEVTPDLRQARFYLSIFNAEDKELTLAMIRQASKDIRYKLGQRIRNKVRLIPEIDFYLDSSLDNVFKMEEIFKDLDSSKASKASDDDEGKSEEE